MFGIAFQRRFPARRLFFHHFFPLITALLCVPHIAFAAEGITAPTFQHAVLVLVGCLVGSGGTFFALRRMRRTTHVTKKKNEHQAEWNLRKKGKVALVRSKAMNMRQTITLLLRHIGSNTMVFRNAGELLDIGSEFGSIWNLPDYLLNAGDVDKILEAMSRNVSLPNDFVTIFRELLQSDADGHSAIRIEFVDGRSFDFTMLIPDEAESTIRVALFQDPPCVCSSERNTSNSARDSLPLSVAQIHEYAQIAIHETAKRLDAPLAALRGAMSLVDASHDESLKHTYINTCLGPIRCIIDELDSFQALTPFGICIDRKKNNSIEISLLLGVLVENALPLAESKGVWLQLDVAQDIPVTVYGQGILLCRLLSLLLHNAIKNTAKGQITLEVRLSPTVPQASLDGHERAGIVFVISDPGAGIPSTEVFTENRMKREESIRSGIWINVAMCLATSLGGLFWLESDSNGGTTCFVDIPFSLHPKAVSEECRREKMAFHRILVADDDTMNRRFASRFLEEAGFEVVEAVDGKDALEKIEQTAPQVVLLDISMPELNGLDVTRILRAGNVSGIRPDIPIMALTASDDDQNQHFIDAGFTAVISKPFDIDVFKDNLEIFRYRTLLKHGYGNMYDGVQNGISYCAKTLNMFMSHFTLCEHRFREAILSGDRGELVESARHINELAALMGMDDVRELAAHVDFSLHTQDRKNMCKTAEKLHLAIQRAFVALHSTK